MDFVFPTFVRASTDDVAATEAALEASNTPKISLFDLVIAAGGELGLVPQRERARRLRGWDTAQHEDGSERDGLRRGGGAFGSHTDGGDDEDRECAVLSTRTSWIPPTYTLDHCFRRAFLQTFSDLHGLRFHPVGPMDTLLPPPPVFFFRDLRLPSVLHASLLQRLQLRYGTSGNVAAARGRGGSRGSGAGRGRGYYRGGGGQGRGGGLYAPTPTPMSFDEVAKAAQLRDLLLSAAPSDAIHPDGMAPSQLSRRGEDDFTEAEEGSWLRPLQQVGLPSMLLGHHTILCGPHQSGKALASCLSFGVHTLRTFANDLKTATEEEGEEEAEKKAGQSGAKRERNSDDEPELGEANADRCGAADATPKDALPRGLLLVPSFNELREWTGWLSDVFGPHAFRFFTLSQDGADILPYQSDSQTSALERERTQAEAEEEARWRAEAAAAAAGGPASEPIGEAAMAARLVELIQSAAADLPLVPSGAEPSPTESTEKPRDKDDARRRRRRRRDSSSSSEASPRHRSSHRRHHRHRRHRSYSSASSEEDRNRSLSSRASHADRNSDDTQEHTSRSRRHHRSRPRHHHRRRRGESMSHASDGYEAKHRRADGDAERNAHHDESAATAAPPPLQWTEPGEVKVMETAASSRDVHSASAEPPSAMASWLPSYLRRGCPILVTTASAFQRSMEINDGHCDALRLELVRTCAVLNLEKWIQPPLAESFPPTFWMRLCTAMDVECQFIFTVRRSLKPVVEFVRNTVLPDIGATTRLASAAAAGDDEDEEGVMRDGDAEAGNSGARLIIWEQADETIWGLTQMDVKTVAVESSAVSATTDSLRGGRDETGGGFSGPRVSMEEIDIAKVVQAASMVLEFFLTRAQGNRSGCADSNDDREHATHSIATLSSVAGRAVSALPAPAPPPLSAHRYLQPPSAATQPMVSASEEDPTMAPLTTPPQPHLPMTPSNVAASHDDACEHFSWQGPRVVVFTNSRREQQFVESQLCRVLRESAVDRRAALIRVGTSCESFTRGELEVLVMTDTQTQDTRETRTLAVHMREMPEMLMHFSLPRVAVHGSLEDMRESLAFRQRAVLGHTHKAITALHGKGKIPTWILMTEHNMNGKVGTRVMEVLTSVS